MFVTIYLSWMSVITLYLSVCQLMGLEMSNQSTYIHIIIQNNNNKKNMSSINFDYSYLVLTEQILFVKMIKSVGDWNLT